MSSNFKAAVCKGSVYLGNGCGYCERCAQEEADYLAAKAKQAAAQSDDVFKVDTTTIATPNISGLPVKGYQAQPQWAVDLVNENKVLEERVLRQIDRHVRNRDSKEIDQAMVQLARRHVEDAFMRLNRAVFQPKRLEGDLD